MACPSRGRQSSSSTYPLYPWVALCIIEGLGSLLALVLWPYVFSHLGNGKLEKVFAADEGIAHPDEAHLRWFFKVFQAACAFSFASVLFINVPKCYNWLHPAFSALCSGISLLLYVAGIAGVGAFTFALGLEGACRSDTPCYLYKAGFFAGHVAGYCYVLHLVLDGYAWGRMDAGRQYMKLGADETGFGLNDNAKPAMASQVYDNTAYEPDRQ